MLNPIIPSATSLLLAVGELENSDTRRPMMPSFPTSSDTGVASAMSIAGAPDVLATETDCSGNS